MANRASREREFAASPEGVGRAVERAVARVGWDLPERSDDRVHAVWTSPVFRFCDDVFVSWRPSNSGSVVRVDSRSRVGLYDFGQNARHVRQLLRAVEKELAG